METTNLHNDTRQYPIYNRKEHTKKKQNNRILRATITSTFTLAIIVLSLLYAGGRIYASRNPIYPANAKCIEYAEKVPVQLKAQIDSSFGVAIPEGTPSSEEILSLKEQCFINQDKTANMAVAK